MPDTSLPTGLRSYRVYGVDVTSELRFGSLEAALPERGRAAVRIVDAPRDWFEGRTGGGATTDDGWIQHTLQADGAVHMKVGGLFEALISADGREVACRRLEAADAEAFEASLVNFVLVAALTLQGEETLHSTVVDLGGRSVGLLGPSGAGKSTLAASLLAAGAELVTDDMLRVAFSGDRILAHCGPHRLKLFEHEARRFLPETMPRGRLNPLSGKVVIEPGGPPHRNREPRPLAALFWLDEAPAVDVAARVLAGADLLKVLVASTMDVRYATPARLARQLRFAERLARVLPVYELRYPRNHSALASVAAEIRRVVDA